MRVLLSEGSGLTSRQVATRLGALGHHVEILSSTPFCLTRFARHVRALHRVPRFADDPMAWFDATNRIARLRAIDVLLPTQEQVAVLSAQRSRLEVATVRLQSASVRTATNAVRAVTVDGTSTMRPQCRSRQVPSSRCGSGGVTAIAARASASFQPRAEIRCGVPSAVVATQATAWAAPTRKRSAVSSLPSRSARAAWLKRAAARAVVTSERSVAGCATGASGTARVGRSLAARVWPMAVRIRRPRSKPEGRRFGRRRRQAVGSLHGVLREQLERRVLVPKGCRLQ